MRLTTVVVIVALTLAIAGGAALATRHFIVASAAGGDDGGPVAGTGPMFAVDEVVTNLADDYRHRFLQVRIELEVSNTAAVRELNDRNAPVRDRIIAVLRSKTADDLAGEDGMRELGEEIVEALNEILRQGRVTGIFFTKFIIQ